jgi:hypothetical protein
MNRIFQIIFLFQCHLFFFISKIISKVYMKKQFNIESILISGKSLIENQILNLYILIIRKEFFLRIYTCYIYHPLIFCLDFI